MPVIELLPKFAAAIATFRRQSHDLPIRPNVAQLGTGTQLIDNTDAGEALVAQLNRLRLVQSRSIPNSGLPAAGRSRSRPLWQDPTTLQPLLLSGAAWIPASDTVIRFVFDLRQKSLVPIIDRLLRLRMLFVAHYFDAEFKTLWALGLDPVWPTTYDTWVAAHALTLGHGHRSIDLLAQARVNEDVSAEEEARKFSSGTCLCSGSAPSMASSIVSPAPRRCCAARFAPDRRQSFRPNRSNMLRPMPRRRCGFTWRSSAT